MEEGGVNSHSMLCLVVLKMNRVLSIVGILIACLIEKVTNSRCVGFEKMMLYRQQP
jgi:hypothetical protein